MDISNAKLVLWGHIIILIIILLVGFGMMFNVIKFSNTSNKINSTQYNHSNEIELTLEQLAQKECLVNNFSLDNGCIYNTMIEYSVYEDNMDLCFEYTDTFESDCMYYYLDNKLSLDLNSIDCQNLENHTPICEEIYESVFNSLEIDEVRYDCELNDYTCHDNYLFIEYKNNMEEIQCNNYQTSEFTNDCQKILNMFDEIEMANFDYICLDLKTEEYLQYCDIYYNEVTGR